MRKVTLDTVYRSEDPAHLLFLNRIRSCQPEKVVIRQYFQDRHWKKHLSLRACVRHGAKLAEERHAVFTWLACTNKGSAEVCRAALAEVGLDQPALDAGYPCDPTSKSTLRIIVRPGIVLRLTRNLDKQRGYVNGALAVIVQSLLGNAVFIAKLVGSGQK